MSAASAFVGHSAAYLLTDAGTYMPDGTIATIGSKVLSSDRLRIAFAMTGRGCLAIGEFGRYYSPTEEARELLDHSQRHLDFLEQLPSLMRRVHAVMANEGGGFFQFTIALWNVIEHRPEGYVIGSPGHTLPGLAPFELAGVRESVMPQVDRSLWPEADLTRSEALAIIQEQRRYRQPNGSIHVGGFAELTTVSERGIATEELIRWPDRIGHKVGQEPTLGERLTALHGLPGTVAHFFSL